MLADSGRGLLIIQALAPEVSASVRANAGMVVSVTLPVPRRTTTTFDPPRRRTSVLPAMDEARPEGGFGKESFLRAIVVQLSQAVETNHGPDAAEAAVAQVGTDVGWQMEEEFRLAEQVVGRMTPEQLGRCFVRLKHAIDGGFSVVEATPERIVLENTRCPFGDAVLRAPALCRMTSSVFGGIAARNSPNAVAVLLEERIAVGDPGCRVVVSLVPPAAEAAAFAHHYRAPARTPVGRPPSPPSQRQGGHVVVVGVVPHRLDESLHAGRERAVAARAGTARARRSSPVSMSSSRRSMSPSVKASRVSPTPNGTEAGTRDPAATPSGGPSANGSCSTDPSARSTDGGGWPALATSRCRRRRRPARSERDQLVAAEGAHHGVEVAPGPRPGRGRRTRRRGWPRASPPWRPRRPRHGP